MTKLYLTKTLWNKKQRTIKSIKLGMTKGMILTLGYAFVSFKYSSTCIEEIIKKYGILPRQFKKILRASN